MSDPIAKLKARVKKLEAERFQLFDDARYAGLLRRFIKEKQWGGVFMVMANYFGADHIGIPPDMQEVMAENKRLQQQISRLEFANRDRIHDLNQLGGLCEENARLKAEKDAETKATFEAIRTITQLRDENERLRKAGDWMREAIEESYIDYQCRVDRWNAAKDGKPNA